MRTGLIIGVIAGFLLGALGAELAARKREAAYLAQIPKRIEEAAQNIVRRTRAEMMRMQ